MRKQAMAELVAQLTERLVIGDRLALSRLLTLIERGDDTAVDACYSLPLPQAGHIIGFTGPPGVGKSSLVAAIVSELRDRDRRVGVLAIDPSSARTGGAVLGDRIRMTAHTHDTGVYIRSLANRGKLGGLASAVPAAANAVIRAGFDTLLIETAGVGQSEIDIARFADTTALLALPGSGDGIQAIKSGILEEADVVVVNKGDLEGARQAARDLRQSLTLAHGTSSTKWKVPVVVTSAISSEGVAELIDTFAGHRAALDAPGIHGIRGRRAQWAVEDELARLYDQQRIEVLRSPGGRAALQTAATTTTSPRQIAAELFREACEPSRLVPDGGLM